MRAYLHKNFKKDYKKLTESQKRKFRERRDLFLKDEFDPLLSNHALKGKYEGYRSINVTGDLRAIFLQEGKTVIFAAIGTHSNLYR